MTCPTSLIYRPRDFLPSRSDLLWRVEWGVARAFTWSEEGAIATLGYWGPGDVIGPGRSTVTPYQIECLTQVEAAVIPENRWHQVLEAIVAHARQTEELLSILHREPISERLRQFLSWLGQKFGSPVHSGVLIDLRLTHQDLAEAIGTTRVTVTRLLKELEEEGEIRRERRHYITLCRPRGSHLGSLESPRRGWVRARGSDSRALSLGSGLPV